ncbi:hypothetical protein MTO96_025778 [Rhipicephalus appendiculatus]
MRAIRSKPTHREGYSLRRLDATSPATHCATSEWVTSLSVGRDVSHAKTERKSGSPALRARDPVLRAKVTLAHLRRLTADRARTAQRTTRNQRPSHKTSGPRHRENRAERVSCGGGSSCVPFDHLLSQLAAPLREAAAAAVYPFHPYSRPGRRKRGGRNTTHSCVKKCSPHGLGITTLPGSFRGEGV